MTVKITKIGGEVQWFHNVSTIEWDDYATKLIFKDGPFVHDYGYACDNRCINRVEVKHEDQAD